MRWIHRGPAEMAAAIMDYGDDHDWRAAGDDAHAQAAAAFNLARVWQGWHWPLTTDPDGRAPGDAAHAQAAAAFNLARVCQAWHGLLTADLDPAVPGPILELLG